MHDEPDRYCIPYLRQLDCEMRKQNQFGATPLFLCRWDFLLATLSVVNALRTGVWKSLQYILNLVFVEV